MSGFEREELIQRTKAMDNEEKMLVFSVLWEELKNKSEIRMGENNETDD